MQNMIVVMNDTRKKVPDQPARRVPTGVPEILAKSLI